MKPPRIINGQEKTEKNPKGAGAQRIKLNWDDIDKLCYIQATLSEIASFCDCSPDTIERACLKEKNVKFAEYFESKRGKGKVSLRRKQFDLAINGDRVMLIWLGKQYLGQAEKHELAGRDGGALELSVDYKTQLLEKLKINGNNNECDKTD